MSSFVHAQTDVNQVANSIGNSVSAQTHDSGNLNESQIRPASGKQDMKTFDGAKSFDGKVVCKGSSEYLRLLVQPTAGGNVTLLNIQQDANLDGKLDISMSPGWTVSAVCSNGFMTCSDPNNSSTCQSYAWVADKTSFQLGRQRVALTDLGGCYCINDQCGNNLAWSNMNQILQDLGSGASSALAVANPWYVMSEVKVDGVMASVVGGEGSSCTVGDSTGFLNTPTGQSISNYAQDPNSMVESGKSYSSSSSAYQAITTGSLNAKETSQTRSCTVTRNIGIDEPTLSDIIAFDGGEGQVTQCGSDCLELILGKLGDDYWPGWNGCTYYEVNSNFIIKRPERIVNATLSQIVFDDWLQLWVGQNVIWNGPYGNWTTAGGVPGRCELSTQWNYSPNLDFKQFLQNPGALSIKIRVAVEGAGEGYGRVRIKTDMSCKLGQEYISDGCSAYESDSSCHLVDEEIDGVKSFNSGINTGLKPLAQTHSISGNFCSITATRDWFTKKRTYRCNTTTDFDTKNIIDRKAYIDQNVKPDHYKDKMFSTDGKVSYGEGDLFWPAMPTVSECVNVCKTRKPKTTPDMSASGQVDKVKNTGQVSYNYYYHECGTSNTCTPGDGEEVVKACQCINEFAEAAAIMQIMRQAGKDLICSSGTERNPDGSN
ncbi:conjugal transfer protein TraN [Dickeya sp. NCPPB 3274]|uniref:conjugal transfer protein TraN n=1 Tax=Dickeya sp. NCPPB 3274 TaxID=568766 RepID=UPI0012685BAF|nr:conjugal transfer protein TraN [Dickeya sp. NCPPB 3274]